MPLGARHTGVEKGFGHKVEASGDRLEVVSDLLAERVAAGGDVIELLEHREVDVRLDVAHDARVTVPVPGAPDASRLVDDADPLEAGLAELDAGEDPGNPPAHDHDIDVVGDRVALDERCEWVVTVAGEMIVGLQVADAGAAGDQPFVALGEVLGSDGLGVVVRGRTMGSRHASNTRAALVLISWCSRCCPTAMAVRISEIDVPAGVDPQLSMFGCLRFLVPGQGSA